MVPLNINSQTCGAKIMSATVVQKIEALCKALSEQGFQIKLDSFYNGTGFIVSHKANSSVAQPFRILSDKGKDYIIFPRNFYLTTAIRNVDEAIEHWRVSCGRSGELLSGDASFINYIIDVHNLMDKSPLIAAVRASLNRAEADTAQRAAFHENAASLGEASSTTGITMLGATVGSVPHVPT